MIPKTSYVRQDDTHRLIPSRYSDESVLARLADKGEQLQELFALDGATNDRLLGEANLLPGIRVHVLFGVAYAHIVNAAFTHGHPLGSRFNGPERGAWYAAFELQTAQAEVAFHKAQELLEINWTEPETFTFDDYLTDFRADVHDIRAEAAYAGCLSPTSYARSQRLARELLASGSAGIVYPSVRHSAGTCIGCFRPALVTNVRKGGRSTSRFRSPARRPSLPETRVSPVCASTLRVQSNSQFRRVRRLPRTTNCNLPSPSDTSCQQTRNVVDPNQRHRLVVSHASL